VHLAADVPLPTHASRPPPPERRPGDPMLDEVIGLLPQLRAYALMLTRTSEQADDLIQDVLVKVLRFRDRFEPGTNLKAWLFSIVRNTYLGGKRRHWRMVQDVEGQLAGKLSEAPAQEWRLSHNDLVAALDKLPADSRSLLLLIAAGTSYEEAAEICACPIGTIRSRLSRARSRLQAALDGGEVDEVPN
jgi:RNA polymerase sigma-70 factor (ECF subfamily)